MTRIIDDPLSLIEHSLIEIAPSALPALPRRCREISEDLAGRMQPEVFDLAERVVVLGAQVIADLDRGRIAALLGLSAAGSPFPITMAAEPRLTSPTRAMRQVDGGGGLAAASGQDAALVKLIGKGPGLVAGAGCRSHRYRSLRRPGYVRRHCL